MCFFCNQILYFFLIFFQIIVLVSVSRHVRFRPYRYYIQYHLQKHEFELYTPFDNANTRITSRCVRPLPSLNG